MNNQVKIFVSYKNKHKLISSNVVIPIQTGRAISDEVFQDMIGDNTGDNISSENDTYCELTAQYWVWKNYNEIGAPNYVGFMHYRRLFDFNRKKSVDFSELNFSKKHIFSIIKNFDIIVSKKICAYSNQEKKYKNSIIDHWTVEHNIVDINYIYKRVIDLYPEYKNAFDTVLKTDKIHWYNIFIMKKEQFFDYSNWLFSILNFNINDCIEQKRIKGFFGEILLNVYVFKHQNELKIKEISLYRYNELQKIPVVLSSSNEYLPYCATTMLSMLNNVDKNFYLCFYILTNKKISQKLKKKITNLKKGNNYKISFIDVSNKQIDIFQHIKVPKHINNITFLRLLLPHLLPNEDKVIYIDSDTLVLDDISKLYSIDMDECPIAGCEDVNGIVLGKSLGHNMLTSKYINAGVLLLDLQKLRNTNYIQKLNDYICNFIDKYQLGDQDLINDIFRGNIKVLSTRWNVHHWFHSKRERFIPDDIRDYNYAQKHPSIIHFVGNIKPWNKDYVGPYKDLYFNYYKQTPFYNNFINNFKNNIIRIKKKIFHKSASDGHSIYFILGFQVKKCRTSERLRMAEARFIYLNKKIEILQNRLQIQTFCSVQNGQYIFATSLLDAFIKHINSKEMLIICKKYIQNTKLKDLSNDDLLIYIATLIENEDYVTAKAVLLEYIKRWGLVNINKYFIVSKFAVENGYNNVDIEKATIVYEQLLRNIITFKNLVKDKSVAVVGNGPSEIGKRKGNEIDSHDLVIRVNNYDTQNYIEDYGQKTDIWVRGMGSVDVKDMTKDNFYQACVWATDYSQFPILYNFLDIMHRDINVNKILSLSLDKNFMRNLKMESGVFFPTTGFNILNFLLKECSCKKISAYGFSFLQESVDDYSSHYFNDRTIEEAKQKSFCHNFDLESRYLLSVMKNNNILYKY